MLDFLLPRICADCRTAVRPNADRPRDVERELCARCAVELRAFDETGCQLCQQPFVASRTGEARCGRCLGERSPLSSCTAAVVFQRAAETWIRNFKYPRAGLEGLAPGPEAVAGALVRDAVALSRAPLPDLVIPIPLHDRRLRARGFNPAALLARAVARSTGVALDSDTLLRRRDTPSQTRLDRRQRRINMRDAFACAQAPPAHVWLVDDVVTTGSTLEEAARCLRRAGTKRVDAICAARTT